MAEINYNVLGKFEYLSYLNDTKKHAFSLLRFCVFFYAAYLAVTATHIRLMIDGNF